MDVALIERALKDADRFIDHYFHEDIPSSDYLLVREQITLALIELRKIPTIPIVEAE